MVLSEQDSRETTKFKLYVMIADEAEDLGRMYAAYTDGDEVSVMPRFDELTRQALKVRDLQRQLRELA